MRSFGIDQLSIGRRVEVTICLQHIDLKRGTILLTNSKNVNLYDRMKYW